MKYIPEEKLREICSEVNGTFGLYVSLPDIIHKFSRKSYFFFLL